MIFLARLMSVVGGAGLASGLIGLLLAGQFTDARTLEEMPQLAPLLWALTGIGGLLTLGGAMLGSDLVPVGVARTIRHTPRVPAAGTSVEPKPRSELPPAVDPGPAYGLELMVPPGHSDSWVGGRPFLPRDVPWPDLDGHPCRFVAQIALHMLPPDIWGGLAPKSGWLVFFQSATKSHGGRILHTRTLGEERQPPSRMLFEAPYIRDDQDLADDIFGTDVMVSSRWPLRVSEPPPMEEHRPDFLSDLKTVTWRPGGAWHPFDWETLQLALVLVERQCGALLDQLDPASPRAVATEAVRAQAQRFRAEAVSLSDHAPFDLAFATVVTEWLEQPQLPFARDGKPFKLAPLAFVLPRYRTLFEMRARQIYAADPEALPLATRTLFEPFWRQMAAADRLVIGGDAEELFSRGEWLLLALPSSRMLNWSFGDWSDWGALIDGHAIADGRWGAADFGDNHG